MSKVSVIIITLNEGLSLKRTVDNLLSTSPATSEILVVDDGSTDGSAGFLGEGYERVRLLRPNMRLGVPQARNFGAAHATGDVFVFSDAHVLTPDGWPDALLKLLDRSEIGAVAPAIAAMRPAAVECTGYGQKWSDASLSVEWLGQQRSEPYPVPLLCGCFLALRRNVFKQIGGFDGGMVLWGARTLNLAFGCGLRAMHAGSCRTFKCNTRFAASFLMR